MDSVCYVADPEIVQPPLQSLPLAAVKALAAIADVGRVIAVNVIASPIGFESVRRRLAQGLLGKFDICCIYAPVQKHAGSLRQYLLFLCKEGQPLGAQMPLSRKGLAQVLEKLPRLVDDSAEWLDGLHLGVDESEPDAHRDAVY